MRHRTNRPFFIKNLKNKGNEVCFVDLLLYILFLMSKMFMTGILDFFFHLKRMFSEKDYN